MYTRTGPRSFDFKHEKKIALTDAAGTRCFRSCPASAVFHVLCLAFAALTVFRKLNDP